MMDAPYKIQIDPERATELAQSGAIILLLDVPTGTVVGIDQQVSMPTQWNKHSEPSQGHVSA